MRKKLTYLIGVTEIIIGISALVGVAIVQATGIYGLGPKSFNVYIFVIVSACFSFVLGVGLISGREWARKLLIIFSGYVILIKILRYGGLLTLNADIISVVTAVPAWTKDALSFLYHVFVITFLSLRKPRP